MVVGVFNELKPSLTLRDRLGNQLFLSHPLHGR
jgi:hypothetical protein